MNRYPPNDYNEPYVGDPLPMSGDDYLGPEPTRNETADRMLGLRDTPAMKRAIHNSVIAAQRDRYEAALRKIAAWKGYEAAPTWFESDAPLSEYETGANDMLETLTGFAKEALA